MRAVKVRLVHPLLRDTNHYWHVVLYALFNCMLNGMQINGSEKGALG